MIDLDKLQVICDAATPGPWNGRFFGSDTCIVHIRSPENAPKDSFLAAYIQCNNFAGFIDSTDEELQRERMACTVFITTFDPIMVDQLIARVRELEGQMAGLQKDLALAGHQLNAERERAEWEAKQ